MNLLARWKHYQSNPVVFPLFRDKALCLSPRVLSCTCRALWCLVWLHELLQSGWGAFFNQSSVSLIPFFCSPVFYPSLFATLRLLVWSCFVPSVNKHRHTCVSGAVFSVDVCISTSLCGLTCFHQRWWYWSTCERPRSPILALCGRFVSDQRSSISGRQINLFMIYYWHKIYQFM